MVSCIDRISANVFYCCSIIILPKYKNKKSKLIMFWQYGVMRIYLLSLLSQFLAIGLVNFILSPTHEVMLPDESINENSTS